MFKFYDTCSLLAREDLDENIVISSITLQELEEIKNSRNKDADVKSAARQVLRTLTDRKGEYEICIFKESMLEPIFDKGFTYVNNDLRILATAVWFDTIHPDEVVFVTNDLALQQIANCFFGEDSIESVEPVEEEYTGYAEVTVHDDETLAHIYEHLNENSFDLLVNQYLLLKDQEGNAIDILKWNGERLIALNDRNINSRWFGKIKPQDPQQRMAIDSLNTNQLTVIRGLPGSGKSLLGLGYLFSLLERHEIERIYILTNPVAVANSCKLGYYPGDRNMKLLDSQLGGFLSTKLGDMSYVQDLVDKGILVLLPAADVRGISIPSSVGVFMTESQNSTKDLMKLLVQRIEEGTKVVIEGDAAQVDMDCYAGKNNGLNALVNTCKGSDLFGTATLRKIHRGRLAELVENMK